MGHLSLQELGTNSFAFPSSSLSTAPAAASVMGFLNRVWLLPFCLMVARRSSITLFFVMMCVCKLVRCDARTFMMGSSLVPRSWNGLFGAAGFAAASVVAGAAVRRLVLALLRLFVLVALSVVGGMILL